MVNMSMSFIQVTAMTSMQISNRCLVQMVLIKMMMVWLMMKIQIVFAGYQEGSETIKEEAFELLDGHDNNCDGLVAAVELDCDDDGSFPLVPGESGSFDRSQTFQMAADIGWKLVLASVPHWIVGENHSGWCAIH